MKSSLLPVIVALALGLFTLRPVGAQDTSAVEQAVKAVAAESKRAWAARDVDACMAVYDTPLSGLLVWGGEIIFPPIAARAIPGDIHGAHV